MTAPNSVIPYPHKISAEGSPAPKSRKVAAAIGALPMVITARLERSAVPKRGQVTMSSTIAGTRNAATARSRSTAAIQRSGSKRGRNHPLKPLRMGPHTSSEPLVVAKGELEMKPNPGKEDGDVPGGRSPTVAHNDALGAPGGPRGVHDVGHVVRAEHLLWVGLVGGKEVVQACRSS